MDSDVKAGQNHLYYNDIATQNVENTVDQALREKELVKTNRRPDLLISYHFFVENETRTASTPNSAFYGPYSGWGRWGYRGYWGWGWGRQQSQQEQYQAGTLVVDMVDVRTRQVESGAVRCRMR